MTTNEILTATRRSAPRGAAPIQPAPSRALGVRLLAATAVLVAVATLTLAPRALVAPVKSLFLRGMDALCAPLMALIPYGDADRVLNTLLFIPLGATIALLLSRRAWPLAILAGFILSAGVEVFQASIPGRVPDVEDVLWNTLGGAIGVMVVVMIRLVALLLGRSRDANQRSRVTRT